MKALSIIRDNRIQAVNALIEIPMLDYLNIATSIINENEFQRKKVINSQISNLLKEDIIAGCSVPSLVLAINKSLIPTNFNYETFSDFEILDEAFKQKALLILDGKQRTHVFKRLYDDLNEEIKNGKNPEESKKKLASFLKNQLRIEVYIGIKKLNILYRMLTLNSGQTSMSTRHLMEMLYLDYLKIDIGDIKLIADKYDEKVANNTTEFSFKHVLDGFTSYLDKDENVQDRSDVLDNIKSAKNLKSEDDNHNTFEVFIKTYKTFLDKIVALSGNYVVDIKTLIGTEFEIKSNPFGVTAIEIFKKSQALSGFGAAIAELKEIREGINLESLNKSIGQIRFSADGDYQYSVHLLLKHFENIRDKSKKIGADQRFYFKFLFRYLFDNQSDYAYCLDKAVEYAYKRTKEEKKYLPEVS